MVVSCHGQSCSESLGMEKRVIIIINSLQIKIIIFFGLQNVIDEIFNKWTTQCSTSGPFLDSFMVGEGWLQSSQDLDAS